MSSAPELEPTAELEARCAWLAVMGIPVWLPRQALPGGPEEQTSWRLKSAAQRPAPVRTAQRLASTQPASPDPAGGSVASGRKQSVAALRETISGPRADSSPVQARDTRVSPVSGLVPRKTAQPCNDKPIHIGVDVRVGGGWMLLAEHGSGYWGERERLFAADLMYACCGDANASALGPSFHWPPTDGERLAARADLARDALAGFLEKCAAEHELHSMVCLGSSLSHWLIQAPKPERIVLRGLADSVRRIALPGVRDMLAQPDSKRHVWRTLSELAHGS